MNKRYLKQSKTSCEKLILKLIDEYGIPPCGLNYTTPFSLVVGLILAAQCTDERVNSITPIFFEKYKTIEDVKNANIEDIKEIIRPCGLTQSKAKSIKESARIICDDYNGQVPSTMKELTRLCGIGRKSANIILQECFNITEGIAVDTHVTRLARITGMSNSTTPLNIEKDLLKLVNKKYWDKLNMLLVTHGRKVCIANRPKCNECVINDICKKNSL